MQCKKLQGGHIPKIKCQ